MAAVVSGFARLHDVLSTVRAREITNLPVVLLLTVVHTKTRDERSTLLYKIHTKKTKWFVERLHARANDAAQQHEDKMFSGTVAALMLALGAFALSTQ